MWTPGGWGDDRGGKPGTKPYGDDGDWIYPKVAAADTVVVVTPVVFVWMDSLQRWLGGKRPELVESAEAEA